MQSPSEMVWRCLAKVPTKEKASGWPAPQGGRASPRRGAGQARQDGQEDECREGWEMREGEGSTPKVVTQTCEDIMACSDLQSPRSELWGHALGVCRPRGAQPHHSISHKSPRPAVRGGASQSRGGGMQILPHTLTRCQH